MSPEESLDLKCAGDLCEGCFYADRPKLGAGEVREARDFYVEQLTGYFRDWGLTAMQPCRECDYSEPMAADLLRKIRIEGCVQ